MEIWKDIPGYEGRYEISDQGRVRSLLFRSNMPAEIMTSTRNYAGYHVISLGSNPKKQHRVHCLVLEAFVGPRPPGMQGCHGRDDKDDNRLSNLRWDTPKANIAERQSFSGEANPNNKLTDLQRKEIAFRCLQGEERKKLAVEFGVTPTRISQIAKAA